MAPSHVLLDTCPLAGSLFFLSCFPSPLSVLLECISYIMYLHSNSYASCPSGEAQAQSKWEGYFPTCALKWQNEVWWFTPQISSEKDFGDNEGSCLEQTFRKKQYWIFACFCLPLARCNLLLKKTVFKAKALGTIGGKNASPLLIGDLM